MKSIKYLIVIVILFVFNAFLIYKLNSYSKAISSISEVFDRKAQELFTFEKNFIKEKENENLVLDKDIKLIDIKGDLVLARELFKKKLLF